LLRDAGAAGVSREKNTMPQRITPFLWFDSNAEEAANFYVSVFPNSEITEVSHYGDAGPAAAGSVMVVSFRLDGQGFAALNGGPEFTFNEAVSFLIDCKSQEEVDYYWDKLTDAGEPGPCGWLKDKFGVSWQVNPTVLTEMLQDKDRERADRVMRAMLQMGKIDIAKLEEAYAQK
jgi:predicted 3-demethylubiquinone-9 3-methyltransferase (glyoxalase superfamily)